MQGDNHDDLNGEVAWREERLDQLADEYRRLTAEIDQIRQRRAAPRQRDRIDQMVAEQRAAEGKTWQERRAEMRARSREIAKRTLAVIGILWLLDWLRSHPQQAVAGVALTAVAATGTAAMLPDSPDLGVIPDGPPQAVVVTPKPPEGRKTAAPAPLEPGEVSTEPGSWLEVSPAPPSGVGPDSPPGGGPGPIPSPSATESPPSVPSPTGTPEPTPTRPPPPPPPSPSPTPTITATPSPSPTPTLTLEPPETPSPTPTVVPDDPLLCLELDEILEACLDLELPIADGLVGGRTFYG